jgi:hypothetical protein
VQRVLSHHEDQTEDEAVAGDEAAFEELDQTLMEVPMNLVLAVRELIARWQARALIAGSRVEAEVLEGLVVGELDV